MSTVRRGTALLAFCVLAPGAAAGQGDTYGRIGFSTAQIYEDNLFTAARARGPESDLISRFGSELEGGYRSAALLVAARYAVDAERYRTHPHLNRAIARQDGGIELHYVPVRRLALDTSASYVDTHAPLELNVTSQLALGRIRAERLTARSAATYTWTRATTIATDYEFITQLAAGTPATSLHSPHIGLEQRRSTRAASRVDYRLRHLSLANGAAIEAAQLVTFGWVQEMTRRTGIEIDAGPRFAEGVVQPEVSVVLRHRARRGEISLGYTETQTTPLGESGMVDVRSLALRVTYVPTRSLTITAAPAFARSNARDGRHVSVRALDVEAIVQLARGSALVVSSRLGRQEGTWGGLHEVFPYRSLSATLRVGFPTLSRA